MRFRQTILMIFAAIAAVFGIIVNALLFTGFVVTTNTQRLEQQSALVLLYPVLLQEQQQQPKQQPEHHAHAHARQLYIYHYNNSNIIDAASIIDTTTSSTPPQAQSAHHQMQYHHDKLMFVHIGKTGGETLKHHLRVTCTTRGDAAKRNKCYKKWQAIAQTNNNNNETTNQTTNIIRHESEISQRTVAIMHCNLLQPPNSARGSGGPQDPITSHLFCLRSPVDRILSWFRYIHPNGCRKIRHDTPNCASKRHMVQGNNTLVTTFARCFPTLLHFLNSLGPPISSPSTTTAVTSNVSNNSSRHLEVCAQTAHAILQATSRNVSIMVHSYFNYDYYASRTVRRYTNRNVLAIRTEHFWSDFFELDYLLGGRGTYQHPNSITAFRHRSKHTVPINMTTSAQGIFNLCCALLQDPHHHHDQGMDVYSSNSRSEIAVYLEILERADNLNATAKLQSKMALLQQCGGFQSLHDMNETCRRREQQQQQ